MKNFMRFLRRAGSVISIALGTLSKYRKISKQFKNDKAGYINASMALSGDAMTRLKDTANIKIEFNGAAKHDGPTIIVANHMSFLDAPIIGSVVNTSFVSKEETANQMFVGPMLRALSTTFIKRTSDDLPRARAELARKLTDGRNIMFFPEATTTDGSFLLPFRAGLLQTLFSKEAKEDNQTALPDNLRLQAYTIRLKSINGIDMEENREETQHLRDIFTNHIGTPNGVFNEMKHTFKYMSQVKEAVVEVVAHAPLNPDDYEDGKALINAARDQILPDIADNVDPNMALWEQYKEGRQGWKAPSPTLMDACKPQPREKAPAPAI